MKSDDEEYKIYEKIYNTESERKEKLMARLNLPLTIIVALLSFLSYLLSKAPSRETTEGVFFWISYIMAVVYLLVAMAHFSKAWRVRNEDLIIPPADKLETYRKTLVDYHDGDREKANSLFMQTMMEYHIMGATRNALNNDSRSIQLDLFSKYVIYAVIVSIIAFTPTYLSSKNQDNKDVRAETTTTSSPTNAKR